MGARRRVRPGRDRGRRGGAVVPDAKPAPSLNAWLAEVAARPPKRRRCLTCENAEIAAAVRKFAEKRKAEQTHVSWAQFHREFLAANGLQIHYLTMMGHVRECLGVRTGG